MSVIYTNALIFTGDRILNDHAVVTDHHIITGIVPASEYKGHPNAIDLQAVHNCVEKVGIPLHTALQMASLHPARALRLDSRLGRIETGYEAAFIVLRDHWDMAVYC
ncbi:Amidohydrolase family protein [Chitinophaga eiseniae]|uniref:Amidohydrolase family protein n=1 Tax=Chitinophaga eiseniae TaxID=634771 RepID=A0A1T4RVF8_9BACT|nr:amidohydrolase family protein [Chitinophaga eiseniae]SKA19571.1 Amidohydrolase family protein [Chitinophaga eiseniae]